VTSRRAFLTTSFAVIVAPLAVAAQPPTKVPRVGIFTTGFLAPFAHLLEGFKQGLRELGYEEGRNIRLEIRYGESKPEQFRLIAAELVRLKVDVIVALPNPAVEAVRQATQTIPIVMPIGADPVGVGFVASLSRPGGNITGLSAYAPELNGKRLELLKEAVPKLAGVGLLMSPNIRGNAADLEETQSAARSLRVRTQLFEVQDSAALDGVFRAMVKEDVDALLVYPGQPTLFANRKQVVELAARHRLPAMYPLADYVNAGGLISYGINNLDLFRRAATYVDKILKGARPADLPIEQPTKFELVINLKTAKALGLTIPPSLRLRADQVIE
jgi:putative tryptophan/tyrosine transport system substrate-binding protein